MGARDAILETLRAVRMPRAAPPVCPVLAPETAERIGCFCAALEAAGGHAHRVRTLADADRTLRALDFYASARCIISRVSGVGDDTFPFPPERDPREADGLEVAIFSAALGVAENGALWVDGQTLPHRALLLYPEHLVLAVSAQRIVRTMPDAYEAIDLGAGIYGIFVSGPSKTADIEQALVIGAQGARSLDALVIEEGFA